MVITHRRALHRTPELDNRLPETIQYVTSVLEPLGCKLFTPITGSVCAYFNAGKADTVAFQADMSARPVAMTADLPFDRLHTSGHDGHTAMLLALAEYAAAHLEELPRNLLLMFRPADGARKLCEAGVLDRYRVQRVFGLQLWPGLPAGEVWSRPGPLMARSNTVTVTVEGQSVYLYRSSEGRDALAAGIDFLQRAYGMLDQMPPDVPRVLRFGKMTSGSAYNTVSGHTVLQGSLRTYTEKDHRFLRQRLQDIGKSVAADSGCSVTVDLSEGFPAVWNHEALYDRVCRQLGDHAPALLEHPVLATKDFSFYQQQIPGLFFFLGAGQTAPLHDPRFDFDDTAILPRGVDFLQKLLMLP